jgi:hypothetical protein
MKRGRLLFLDLLENKWRWPAHRVKKRKIGERDRLIAKFVLQRADEGAGLKKAKDQAAKKFKVSLFTVRNALERVLINGDCSAIAGCRKRRVRCAGCSGDLLPPSPPAEEATARQDQAGQASTGDRAGDGGNIVDLDVIDVEREAAGEADLLGEVEASNTPTGATAHFSCSTRLQCGPDPTVSDL